MIIDAHVHIHPFPSPTNEVVMPPAYEQNLREDLRRLGIDPDHQAETMVRRMDAAGVDACFVVNPHYPKDSGHVRTNQSLYEEIAPYKGRIYALAGTQVRPEPDVHGLEHALSKFDFRGLKINVSGQFVRPVDYDVLDPVYQVLIQHDLPVMWHPGPSFTGGLQRFEYDGREYYDAAHRHPELKIVIAHCGSSTLGGLEMAAIVASACKNVYLDCSALLYVASLRHLPPAGPARERRRSFTYNVLYPESGEIAPDLMDAWNKIKEEYREMIRYFCNRAPGKLLYGTDLPLTDRWDVSIELCREALRDEVAFAEVMSDTARKVFRL